MRWFMSVGVRIAILSAVTAVMAVTAITASAAAEPAKPKPGQGGKALPPLQAGSVFAFLPTPTRKQAGAVKSDDAVRAIADYLRSHGFKVLPAGQVRSKLASHALEGCTNPTTCDPALALATLRADAVVSTAVWQRPSGPRQLVVHVRRQQGYGQSEVNLPGATPKAMRSTAVKALREALEDSQRTHEINVLIESLPMGATVHVDQTLTGTTPAHFALLPGSHLVSVEASGFITSAQYLELPEHGMSETRLSLKLSKADNEPAADTSTPGAAAPPGAQPAAPAIELAMAESEFSLRPAPAPPRDESSRTNYVVAAVLFGIAAPLVANAVFGAATNGKCVGQRDNRGNCSERVGIGPYFYLSAGLGGLAALGGSAFLILQPLRTPHDALAGAQLQLTQQF